MGLRCSVGGRVTENGRIQKHRLNYHLKKRQNSSYNSFIFVYIKFVTVESVGRPCMEDVASGPSVAATTTEMVSCCYR